MNSTKSTFVALTLLFGAFVSTAAIKPIPVQYFPFENNQSVLTNQLMKLADSIYANITPGESIKLVLLSAEEQNLESVKRAQLSFKRAEALIEHCRKNKYSSKDYYAEMVPFTTPHTIKSNIISESSYKLFMSTKALTYFVFNVKQVSLTSKSGCQFDASTEKEKQEFTFNPKEEIVANLVSGTKIIIPASSLCYLDGHEPEADKIVIKVSEYLELDAMVMKAMTTSSHGKALQTGGMWNITAECNGKPLMMKGGKSYDIQVAKTAATKNMKVFTGKMNNGILDWTEEKDGSVTASTINSNVIPETTSNLNVISENRDEANEINIKNNLTTTNLNLNQKNYRNRNNKMEVNEEMDEDTKKRVEQYNKQQEEKQKDIYDLKLNDFGWINCDAFDSETQKLTDILVRGDINDKSNVMLVFAKRKSVLSGYLCEDGKSVKFTNVAADEAAMLIVFEKTGDGDKVMVFSKMITPGNQKSVNVNTVASTLAQMGIDMKTRLADYN